MDTSANVVHVAPWDRFVPSEKLIMLAVRAYEVCTRNHSTGDERKKVVRTMVQGLWRHCQSIADSTAVGEIVPCTTIHGELQKRIQGDIVFRVLCLPSDTSEFSVEFARCLVDLARQGTYRSCTMQLELVDDCAVVRRTL